MTIVKFPDRLKRRLAARKPRRSKNGTPEERAARAAAKGEVVSIDRRAMLGTTAAALAGGAALNVAAIVAAKAETRGKNPPASDPILDALDRYNRAHAFHSECLDQPGCEDGLADIGSRAELDAIDALLRTVPTTTAGAATLVRFLLAEADKEYVTTLGASFGDDDTNAFLRSIAAFLDQRAVLS